MRASMTRALRILLPLIVLGMIAAAVPSTVEATASAKPPRGIDPAAGIENIDHFVFIVQENRSFDHYFGTFPGANGIPRTPNGRFKPCVPDPTRSVPHALPRHEPVRSGRPARRTALERSRSTAARWTGSCGRCERSATGCTKPETMTTTRAGKRGPGPTASPTSWASTPPRRSRTTGGTPSATPAGPDVRARRLLDAAVAPVPGVGVVGDMLRSRWTGDELPLGPRSSPGTTWPTADASGTRRWAPAPVHLGRITWLLKGGGRAGRYYVGPGTCVAAPCDGRPGQVTAPVQNPLPGFRPCAENHKLGTCRRTPSSSTRRPPASCRRSRG